MTGTLTFPIFDELAFEQTIGAWQGIHDELGHFYGDAITKLQSALGEWHGQARLWFLTWWWGNDGRTDSNQGAKGDVAILLQVIDDVITALNGFRDAIASINGWLTKANLLIAENTTNGVFTLHNPEGNPPGHFGIVGGRMSEQTVPGCYILLEPSSYDFPYHTDDYKDGNSNYRTPDWWIAANSYAATAVGEFNTACQTCISRLGDVQNLARQVHWLKPYTQPVEGGGQPTIPDQDRVWELLSGDMTRRPYPFKPGNVLGTVTYKDGKVVLAGDGSPFAPANVPSGYFKPGLFDDIVHAFEKYGLDALTVLLAGVGLGEGAAIIDTFVDSSAFYGALLDAVAGRSIVGVALSGYDLVVDSGAAKSLAEEVAEQMLGGRDTALYNEFGDKLVSQIENQILASPESNGQYHVNPSTLTTPSASQNTGAANSGYNSVVDPIYNDHPTGSASPGVAPRS